MHTLSSWLNEWLMTYKAHSVTAGTAEMYSGVIRLIQSHPIGNTQLDELTESDIQQFLNRLHQKPGKSYSKSYLSKIRITLNQALKKAVSLNIIPFNPCGETTLPKAPTKRIQPLSHDDEARIIMACHDDPLGDVFVFLLATGLRMCEIRELTWPDFDSQKRLINVRKSKTEAGIRPVWLISAAYEIINQQPRNSMYIFSNKKKQLSPATIRRGYERLQKAAQVPCFTTHVCRHTFVTRLCERGISAKAIAQIVGHAKAGYVMDIYADIESDGLRKSILALEEDSKTRTGELLIELPQEQYQVLIRLALDKGMPIDHFVVHQMKLLCREYIPR